MSFDLAAFIQARTQTASVPLRPDIELYLTDDTTKLWQDMQDVLHADLPLPFWASAWAGGQALARYILDHPGTVYGKRVLDFASGSGLIAIAAAKAGAAHVEANDIDACAIEAIRLNSLLNNVSVHGVSGDIVGRSSSWDIVFAGDVSYERAMAEHVTPWLALLASQGTRVLIGDPGRTYLARDKLHALARYDVPVSRNLEDRELKATDVWEFKSVR